jgi:hypothetical protein
VDQHSRAFVGIDTSKLRNAVAVAEDGRGGDVRYLGEIDTTEAATRKLVTKLAAKYRQLTFCYRRYVRLTPGAVSPHMRSRDETRRMDSPRPAALILIRTTSMVLPSARPLESVWVASPSLNQTSTSRAL